MTDETKTQDKPPSVSRKPWANRFSPGRVIIFSFMLIISIGTVLLYLPFAHTEDLSLINAFFTSASSTCVTGLHVVPMSSFTFWGRCVILGLVQIGGLGLMTMSFFLASLFLGKLGVAARAVASEMFEFSTLGKMKTFLILIVTTTFGIEAIGTCALYPSFKALYPTGQAIFMAIFHSVTAFCNAGITISDTNLIGLEHERFMLAVLGILVFAGGLGFAVLYELTERMLSPVRRTNPSAKRLSLHTRMVLKVSLALILVGAAAIWLLEGGHTLAGMGLWDSIENALLHSVWLRSAGFFTTNIGTLAPATLFVFIFLMLIGASPGSTGGGIKTTTFSLFVATLASTMRKRDVVEIRGRTIAQDQLNKSIAIVALTVLWLVVSVFVLLLTEPGHPFLEILFESASALSTTGLSTGITPTLSTAGKAVLVANMITGRIGALTLIFALRKKREKQTYRFPEERVLLG